MLIVFHIIPYFVVTSICLHSLKTGIFPTLNKFKQPNYWIYQRVLGENYI